MSDYFFPPAPVTALEVCDGEGASLGLFPVRRVYCVGQNYAEHVVEMGGDPNRSEPFFFQKNPQAVMPSATEIAYPPGTEDLHHEVELVAALGAGGTDLSLEAAREAILGYGVGVDMTRRDQQAKAKANGRPWEVGKSFEQSAPTSPLIRAEDAPGVDGADLWLNLNGDPRQSGNTGQMIWKTVEAISYLSRLFTLAPGDLIFTGTPAGVSSVVPGDRVECGIDGVGRLAFTIT